MSTERRVFGLLMSQLFVSFSLGTLVGSHDRWTTAFSAATILCSAVGVLRTCRVPKLRAGVGLRLRRT
ncbi:MAG: hypothetical protein JWL99_1386 [Streptomyces oryziradicis]|nr:hypothetical protein [Actinacidiphila oryziradicis]